MSFIELRNVVKEYRMGEVAIRAADGINFSIQEGEFAVIVGPSGAGKTTVLNILGGMDTCTSGEVIVGGTDIGKFGTKQLAAYRRDEIGFVFQFYNLIQNLTALENVEIAAQICSNPLDARKVMKEVGLEMRMDNFPAQLSGGEQQRVAIARALAKNPKLLLCDEP
ncbi:MAG: ABC transporter ATP-binding protein, partial [Lachnospiraceae bacterium]|nr:ABC transporter ATP-binding protein [Lachnospiraceae bacterium]